MNLSYHISQIIGHRNLILTCAPINQPRVCKKCKFSLQAQGIRSFYIMHLNNHISQDTINGAFVLTNAPISFTIKNKV